LSFTVLNTLIYAMQFVPFRVLGSRRTGKQTNQ
jgi:hypothetical protein